MMMMNVVFKGSKEVWNFMSNNVFEDLEVLFDTFKDFEVWGVDRDGETVYFN